MTEHEGKPFEVFIAIGKTGGCINALLEAVGRMLSWGLRSGASLEEAAEQLINIRCPSPFGNINLSCVDAVGQKLMEIAKKYANPTP